MYVLPLYFYHKKCNIFLKYLISWSFVNNQTENSEKLLLQEGHHCRKVYLWTILKKNAAYERTTNKGNWMETLLDPAPICSSKTNYEISKSDPDRVTTWNFQSNTGITPIGIQFLTVFHIRYGSLCPDPDQTCYLSLDLDRG